MMGIKGINEAPLESPFANVKKEGEDNVVENGELPEVLVLEKLKNTFGDLMRQQASITNKFNLTSVDLTSEEAREVLDPISEQITEVDRQINEVINSMKERREAA